MDMNHRTTVRKNDYAVPEEKFFDNPASFQDSEYKAEPLPRMRADDSRPWWKRGGPFLSRGEEFWLVQQWRRRGNRAARERILRAHLPLVRRCVGRVHHGLSEQDARFKDAMSAGCVGMALAFTKFDPDLGNRFSTVAIKWILGEVKREARLHHSVIRTPRDATPIPTHNVLDRNLLDETPNPENSLIHLQRGAAEDAALSAAIEALDWRARRVLRARRLTEPAVTLEVLGIELGLSRERVRQIENTAADTVKAAVLNLVQLEPFRERTPQRDDSYDGLDQARRYRMLIDKNYSPELAAALVSSPQQRQIFCAFEADNRAFARGMA